MIKQTLSREVLSSLIDDVSYLQDEAEALKYLIDNVPYDENPPEGYSILNMLRLIDHAQHHYFRPIIEKVLSENRIQKLNDFEHYRDTFTTEETEEPYDIQRVLNKIVKHRAALLNILTKIALIDWEKLLRDRSGKEISLFDFTNMMIKEERAMLKKIADLVLIYQNEKQHQKEINKRATQRNQN